MSIDHITAIGIPVQSKPYRSADGSLVCDLTFENIKITMMFFIAIAPPSDYWTGDTDPLEPTP
jgi:hypothetical protein